MCSSMDVEKWNTRSAHTAEDALAQANLVHKSLCEIFGIECLPSQLPRFVQDKLAAKEAKLRELADNLESLYEESTPGFIAAKNILAILDGK